MMKLLAFDLDGTICDSIPLCIEAFREAASPYMDQELTKQEIMDSFGLNEVGMMKAVVKGNWELALQDFYCHYKRLHDMCAHPFPGIRKIFECMHDNHIPVVLVTGRGEESCHIILEKLKLEEDFHEIYTGSEEKPNKGDHISMLLHKHKIKADEMYYIGDTVSDVMVCKTAEVTCLSAAWAATANVEELKKINSPYVFESVGQLAEFLRSVVYS